VRAERKSTSTNPPPNGFGFPADDGLRRDVAVDDVILMQVSESGAQIEYDFSYVYLCHVAACFILKIVEELGSRRLPRDKGNLIGLGVVEDIDQPSQ